jgi:hypothetical protein
MGHTYRKDYDNSGKKAKKAILKIQERKTNKNHRYIDDEYNEDEYELNNVQYDRSKQTFRSDKDKQTT